MVRKEPSPQLVVTFSSIPHSKNVETQKIQGTHNLTKILAREVKNCLNQINNALYKVGEFVCAQEGMGDVRKPQIIPVPEPKTTNPKHVLSY